MSSSLWPHGPQHARLPCPSLSPGVCSNSCPLSQLCHPIITSSVVPFSSCPQSFPASGSFSMKTDSLPLTTLSLQGTAQPREGPGTRPFSLVTFTSGEQARLEKPENPWSHAPVYSPSFFKLTPPYLRNRTVPSLVFKLQRQLAQQPVLLLLAFSGPSIHCFQVTAFCLNSYG